MDKGPDNEGRCVAESEIIVFPGDWTSQDSKSVDFYPVRGLGIYLKTKFRK